MDRLIFFRLGFALAFLPALAGCAGFPSPQTCTRAAAGLRDAARLAAFFVSIGVEAARAQKLADGVAAGQLLLAEACAEADAVPAPVATPGI